MPTSSPENQNVFIEWYEQISPKKVVDIGIGEGTYSKLLKGSEHWTGIEAWGQYIIDFNLHEHYNHIIIADARYIAPQHLTSDLIIMGDMLEHMKKREAKRLIDTCKQKANNIFISIPVLHLDQEPYEGNWFERHIDHWHYDEMLEYLGEKTLSQNGEIVARYWWHKQ